MKLVKSIMTKNPCYSKGRKMNNGVQGLMLHSVGCSQPKALAFINNWNNSSYDRACVHGFIDANNGTVYQTLPWNWKGWHAGGSANNTHIGVEICEPDCIKYTGGSTFTCSDIPKAKEMVKRTYEAAVELFAMLCKQFSLDPLKDGVIISHAEGHKRGVASNHGDPEYLWSQLKTGYTMDTFRKDVSAKLSGGVVNPKPTGTPNKEDTKMPNKCPYSVTVNIADLCIRTGPGTNYVWTGRYTGVGIFTIVEEKNGWGKLKSGAGWISLAYCTEV